MSQISNLIKNFNWQNPSWDLFILLAWAVVAVLYAFTAGRGRIINILFSTYVAKLLVLEAPFIKNFVGGRLPESVLALQQLITFVVLFLIVFIFLGRYAFRTAVDGRQASALVFGLAFAFLQIGLLINIIVTYVEAAGRATFSPLIQMLFIREPANFIWLVIPLVFLILLGRHVADPHEL